MVKYSLPQVQDGLIACIGGGIINLCNCNSYVRMWVCMLVCIHYNANQIKPALQSRHSVYQGQFKALNI